MATDILLPASPLPRPRQCLRKSLKDSAVHIMSTRLPWDSKQLCPVANTDFDIEIKSVIQGFNSYYIGGRWGDKESLAGSLYWYYRTRPLAFQRFQYQTGESLIHFPSDVPHRKDWRDARSGERTGVVELDCASSSAGMPRGRPGRQQTNRYDPILTVQVPKVVVGGWVVCWSPVWKNLQ